MALADSQKCAVMAERRSRIAEVHGKYVPCHHTTDLGMAFLNYLLAMKATRNLASATDWLDGLTPDNERGSRRDCRQEAGSMKPARARKRLHRRTLDCWKCVFYILGAPHHCGLWPLGSFRLLVFRQRVII